MAGVSALISSMDGGGGGGALNASGTGGVEMVKALSSMQIRNEQFRQMYEQLKQEYETLSVAYTDCQRTLEKATDENRQMQEKFKNLLDKLQIENRKKTAQIEEMKTQVCIPSQTSSLHIIIFFCFSYSTILKSIRFEIVYHRKLKVLTNSLSLN
jgi:hypothetical protein